MVALCPFGLPTGEEYGAGISCSDATTASEHPL